MNNFYRYTKYCICCFTLFAILKCSTFSPKIPISNTLEIALAKNYDKYVELLNKSINNDTIALTEFLKIDNIYDAAGYDHGYIIIQILENVGDSNFANAVKKLDAKEMQNLKQYFEVGFDAKNTLQEEYKFKYPTTFKLLPM